MTLDLSNVGKWWSDAHFLSFLFYYYRIQSFTDAKVDFYQFLKSLYDCINLKNYETPLRLSLQL